MGNMLVGGCRFRVRTGPGEVILLGRKRRAYLSLTVATLGAYRLNRRRTISTHGVKCCK
jgi:hypothetical protein